MLNISLSMGAFSYKISRKVQWVHPFSMNFNGFRSVCLYFSLKVHFRWEHHILSMKGCHAIQPEYYCFISMIISVDTLCGFTPSLEGVVVNVIFYF